MFSFRGTVDVVDGVVIMIGDGSLGDHVGEFRLGNYDDVLYELAYDRNLQGLGRGSKNNRYQSRRIIYCLR